MRRVNGVSVEDYKGLSVMETGLAIPGAEPLYRPLIFNGRDLFSFPDLDSLLLYSPLPYLKGSKFKTMDRYRHTLTVTGALWRPYGRYFDGSDDYIAIGSNSVFNQSGADLSWLGWIRSSDWSGGGAYPTLIRNGNFRLHFGVDRPTGKIEVWINNANQYLGNTALSTDTWYMIGFSLNATTKAYVIYLDGASDKSGTVTANPSSMVNTPAIGGVSGTGELKGDIGEVWIYSAALSADAFAWLYNSTAWRYKYIT